MPVGQEKGVSPGYLVCAGDLASEQSYLLIVELRTICSSLKRWTSQLEGCPIQIQLGIAQLVAYINHDGRSRSPTITTEVKQILSLPELHIPALSSIYIPDVDSWQTNFISQQVCLQVQGSFSGTRECSGSSNGSVHTDLCLSSLKLLTSDLRIEIENITVILIAPDWPRQMW